MISRESKIVCGITLLTVPTIFYGGLALLGMLTNNAAGVGYKEMVLNATQYSLFRAGHAHAGVLVVFCIILQVLLDSAVLAAPMRWISRIAAVIGATTIPGAFFGLAFFPAFRLVLYAGVFFMTLSVVIAGIGLLRKPVTDTFLSGQ